MWFRFSRPDYFYLGRSRLVDAGDSSPFNRGWSQGFGFFVLHCRWNAGRDESEGIHYAARKPIAICVNGRMKMWPSPWLEYRNVLALAGKRDGASVMWTDQSGRSGTLHAQSDPIIATNGMDIDAVHTGNA